MPQGSHWSVRYLPGKWSDSKHLSCVELPFVPCVPVKLGPLECTNVGFLLGKVLANVQTLVCGSKATWLCRIGKLTGKVLVGFTGPCGWSGTLGPPGHGIGIELGHVVHEVESKKATKKVEVCASPGWGLGTPASLNCRCKDLGCGTS